MGIPIRAHLDPAVSPAAIELLGNDVDENCDGSLAGPGIPLADVSCDGKLGMSDAVSIAQYTVGVRTGAQTCPTDLASGRLLPAADISGDGVVSIADAVIVIQCIVGIDKRLLPRMNTA